VHLGFDRMTEIVQELVLKMSFSTAYGSRRKLVMKTFPPFNGESKGSIEELHAKEQDRPNISPMVHPPIVALMFIVIAYFLGRFVPLPFVSPILLRYVGLILTLIGFLFGVGALLEFRKARTTLDLHGSAKQLVTSGIYRFTRNPIYLGFLLMVIGLPLNSGLYWVL
jgi:protein-S-isoprenylcysteine O-methyltransferase Ste14